MRRRGSGRRKERTKKNGTQEDIDSLNRGRERETESWRKQLEDLERGSERAKETRRHQGAGVANLHAAHGSW